MAESTLSQDFSRGFLKENPLFILVLGTCPSLAVTTTLINGIGMGLAATFVLVMSNIFISALRNFIPSGVRIPAYVGGIASFVTIVELLIATGFAEVWLETNSALTAAISLYCKYGFQPVPPDGLLPRCDTAYLLRLR